MTTCTDETVASLFTTTVYQCGSEAPRPTWDIGPKMQLLLEGGVLAAEQNLMSMEILDAEKDLTIKYDNPIVEVTRFCTKWLVYALGFQPKSINPREELARRVIEEFDVVTDEPSEFVKTETRTIVDVVSFGETLESTNTTVTKRQRLRKGCRSKFAISLAKQAYLKFGARPMSQANMLVTRKWLSKILEEAKYKDLRTADKINAIDRALFLSFVASKDFKEMELLFNTKAANDRVLCRISGLP
jgi:hypothetical protein